MRLPRHVWLLGRKIRVVKMKGLTYEGKTAEGLYEQPDKIYINPDIAETDDEQFQVLLHECGHVYCTLLGIDQVLPEWVIEIICQIFGLFAKDIILSFGKKR